MGEKVVRYKSGETWLDNEAALKGPDCFTTTYKGAYHPETVYSYYDTVTYYGGSYIYINPVPSSGNAVSNATYWFQTASAGNYIDTSALNWEGVQDVVRQGYAPFAFPIGSQLVTAHTTYGNIIWDVVAHDYDLDPTGRMPHSMTLLIHGGLANVQADQYEVNYQITTQINSGTTCNITLEDITLASATYDFTAPSNLVVGGLLRISSATNLQYYSTPTATVVNIAMVAGSVNPSISSSLSFQNHKQRVSNGSGNWSKSAIRQFLNSSGEVGTYWSPQTIYDLPPAWKGTLKGFLNGLDSGFVGVLGRPNHITANNTENDGGGSYTTSDIVYIPSYTEIFGISNAGILEGSQYPYYVNQVNASHIKYMSGSAVPYWWLRSPYPTNARSFRYVLGTDGTVNSYQAIGDFLTAIPACAIY